MKHPGKEEHGRTRLYNFFASENEIYALDAERCCHECHEYPSTTLQFPDYPPCHYCANFTRHVSFLKKYKPESNSWETITSFDFGWRLGICIVAKNHFIYFLGGGIPVRSLGPTMYTVTSAGRYDVSTNTWDKIADLQEPRMDAYGAAAYGKIFVAGGRETSGKVNPETYELYNERTNEWQYIAAPSTSPRATCMCVYDKVYAFLMRDSDRVECYDPDSKSWITITQIPTVLPGKLFRSIINICSMRVIKSHDFLEERPLEERVQEPVQEPIDEPLCCKSTRVCERPMAERVQEPIEEPVCCKCTRICAIM